ncbi:MAG: LysM peptidoglycan-binding domain-containing protein [Angustibacter sp.]
MKWSRVGRTAVLGSLGATALTVAAAVASSWLCVDAAGLAAAREPAALLLALTEVAAAALLARCALGALLAVVALLPVLARGLLGVDRTSGAVRPASDPSATARAAVRVTPGLLRPVVCGLLALGVSTTVAGPALAATHRPPLPSAAWSAPVAEAAVPPSTPRPRPAALPSAGWVPDGGGPARGRPTARLVTGAPHRAAPAAGVVVHTGDSLWTIVARALGPGASDARVAGEWPRWYAANRATIGDDPDLLRPGTVLHGPARTATR